MSSPVPVDDRRSRVVYIAGWGSSLVQPGWALELGVKVGRAVVCSFDEAVAVAEAGARMTGYPSVVQKFALKAAAGRLSAERLLLGSWRLRGPDGPWEEA